MGNIYDNVALPVTITLWIYIDPSTPSGNRAIMDSQDGLPAYSGFGMLISKTPHIGVTYGDGLGGNNSRFRASKAAIVNSLDGRWIHIAGVIRGAGDMDIYLNGRNVGGNYEGESTSPMNSDSPLENMHIGVFSSNGFTQWFMGIMDEFRIWNKALTETEIRRDMCRKLTGTEAGLIGYWDFDETSGTTVRDKTANHFDGQLIGNPARVYSGAPIGDESVYRYSTTWSGATLSLDNLTAENITGNPYGLHIYKVNEDPSQTDGLTTASRSPYYGIFLAEDPGGKKFDFKFNTGLCTHFVRKDNSESTWAENFNTTGVVGRTELIPVTGTDFDVDLGDDRLVCDQVSSVLTATLSTDASGKSFLWNTGATTPSITVNQPGEYSVKVTEGCATRTDKVNISFLQSPPGFSLGGNEVLCAMTPRYLKSNIPKHASYQFIWQNGATTDSLEASNFGTYSLQIKNACGTRTASVQFIADAWPDFSLDLGQDQTLCNQTAGQLTAQMSTPIGSKSFLWNTGETSPTITIHQSGKYRLEVKEACTTVTDSVIVIFKSTPSDFSLGEDDYLCPNQLKILKPGPGSMTGAEYQFIWQDGSTADSLQVKNVGEYRLEIRNACGAKTASVRFTETALNPLPNVITPNGDAFNQYFVVDPILVGSRINIVNRWGKKVFESPAYHNDWDAHGLAAGVYFYQIINTCIGTVKGSVHILAP